MTIGELAAGRLLARGFDSRAAEGLKRADESVALAMVFLLDAIEALERKIDSQRYPVRAPIDPNDPRFAGLPKEGVSPEEIAAGLSPRGGWSYKTLRAWGVPIPPPSGWKQELERRWLESQPDKS